VVGLIAVLLATGLVSSAGWAVTLCGLAGAAVLVVTLTGARSVSGMGMSDLAAGFPFVRGVPWFWRSLPHRGTRTTPVWPVIRTVVVTGSLVGLVGALFASADGVFASWTTGALAGVPLGDVPGRLVLGPLVAGVVLVGVVLAVLPPDVDRWSRRSRPAVRRWMPSSPSTSASPASASSAKMARLTISSTRVKPFSPLAGLHPPFVLSEVEGRASGPGPSGHVLRLRSARTGVG
jgi:hypothetical protein